MMKNIKHKWVVFFIAVLAAGIMPPAFSFDQGSKATDNVLPADKLAQDKARCKLGCGQSGQPDDVCELVCQCTVDKFKQGLNYQRYMQLLAELEKRNVSIENQIFLTEVGNACNAELDKTIPERITRLPKPIKKN